MQNEKHGTQNFPRDFIRLAMTGLNWPLRDHCILLTHVHGIQINTPLYHHR